MKVESLFKRLSYAELSNLSIGKDGKGEILLESQPRIINYINDGLLDIFTRFNLREKTVILEQYRGVTNYHLRKEFAECSESDQRNKYIKDLPAEPFEGDVIKIIEVYDSQGQLRTLNDKEDVTSLFTPQPDTLQVPRPIEGEPLGITYQARHEPLLDSGDRILHQDIDIPFFLESALQSYVAHKVYSHINGQENLLKSQEHYAAFRAYCDTVDSKDLANATHHTSHHKLEDRGFV